MIDVDKFAKEPLVWVAAAALCIPMFGSGFLNKLKGWVVFEPNAQPAAVISEAKPIELASASPLPAVTASPELAIKSTASGMNYPRTNVAPFPVAGGAKSGSAPEAKAIGAAQPDPEIEFDPGSLMFEFDEDELEREPEQEDVASKAAKESDDEEFDFLFGAETDSSADQTAAKPQSVASTEDKDRGESRTRKRRSDDGRRPNWLFPEVEISRSKDESRSKFRRPNPESVVENKPADPSIQGLEQPALAWPAPDDSTPGHTLTHPPQNEMFFELESGFDWWTQHCQQAITGMPARHAGLDAVVFAAMQNSPIVKLINTQPEIAQTVISESSANFDWSTFVEASWGDTDRAVVSLLDTGTAGGRFVQQQLLFEAGVKKHLRSGGQLRVGNAFQRTDNNSAFLSPPDQGTSQLILDYRQPLMRGSGKHINASQIMLAQIGAEAASSDSQVKLQQFLVDVVAQYWELYFARSVLVQRIKSLNRAKALLNEMSQRVSAGDASERVLIRIQAVLAARETDVIRAQNQVAIHQETLVNLTHGATTEDFSQIEIVPTEAPGTFLVPYELDYVTEVAVQNRAEVQVALAAIRAAAVEKDLALNDLKPQLDAVIATFVSGVAENKQIGDAFTDSFNNDPSYAVGFSFEVPIGRRAARSRLQRQQLEHQRLQYQLEQTLGNIRLDARLAYRNVQSFAAELSNDKAAASHAAKELEFVAGKAGQQVAGNNAALSSLFVDDVLQSQARLAQAEERLLRSQTDLSIALVELKRATGQLLQATQVNTTADPAIQQVTWNQPVNSATSEGALSPDFNPNRLPHVEHPPAAGQWQPPQQEFQAAPVDSGSYKLNPPNVGQDGHPFSAHVDAPQRHARRLPGRR